MLGKKNSVLSRLIRKNRRRERKLFSEGYREIYRRVFHQIESLIRNHPVLTSGSVVIPTHAIGSICINMEEAKKYVKRQLLKEGIRVVDESSSNNTILVSWLPLPLPQTPKINSLTTINSAKKKQASIVVSSSSSSRASSPSSPETTPSCSPRPAAKPTSSALSLLISAKPRTMGGASVPALNLTNKIPDLVNHNHNHNQTTHKKTNPSSGSTTSCISKPLAKKTSKLSAKDEAKLAQLHTNVMRAATAC